MARGCGSHPENHSLSGSSARPDHSPGPWWKRPASHSSSPAMPAAGCPGAAPGQQWGLGPRDWLRPQTEVCSWQQGQWEEKGDCDLPPGGADVSVSLGVAQRGVSGREDECPGGAGRPLLQTSPGGSRAPGAAPWSLSLEAPETAGHGEVITRNRCCTVKITLFQSCSLHTHTHAKLRIINRFI